MGQSTSRSMCCAVRDKESAMGPSGFGPIMGQFSCTNIDVDLEEPRFLLFAPLWQKTPGGVGGIRRIAMATRTEVHIYRLRDAVSVDDMAAAEGDGEAEKPIVLENTLKVSDNRVVTSVIFCEEASSRNLAVAFGAAEGSKDKAQVRVWNLDMLSSSLSQQRQTTAQWSMDQGHIATLDGQQGPFTMLATSPVYLFGALASGECIVWQKTSGFGRRGSAKLHRGGIADMSADRNFLYTTGQGDCSVSVWNLPQLNAILTIEVSVPKSLMDTISRNLQAIGKAANDEEVKKEVQLAHVSALRLPLSRWAGSQGASRTSKAPKGSIFVAAVLDLASENSSEGPGILMHWIMGEQFACRSAQIAHNSPIVAMVYGPYDNGPLVTADGYGMCRVWDNVPGLICSQQLEFTPSPAASVAFAVEPQTGLYSTFGGKRLVVWRRDSSLPVG